MLQKNIDNRAIKINTGRVFLTIEKEEITNGFSSNTKTSPKIRNKAKIFNTYDENLKFLGEIIRNENGFLIFNLLNNEELTVEQASSRLGLSLSLTSYYIRKMEKAGMLYVTRKKKNAKGHEIPFYSAVSAVIILPEYQSDSISKQKRNTITKMLTKFSIIGMSATFVWMLAHYFSLLEEKTPPEMAPPSTIKSPDEFLILVMILNAVMIVGAIKKLFFDDKNKTNFLHLFSTRANNSKNLTQITIISKFKKIFHKLIHSEK